jgi:hypothetical protein
VQLLVGENLRQSIANRTAKLHERHSAPVITVGLELLDGDLPAPAELVSRSSGSLQKQTIAQGEGDLTSSWRSCTSGEARLDEEKSFPASQTFRPSNLDGAQQDSPNRMCI